MSNHYMLRVFMHACLYMLKAAFLRILSNVDGGKQERVVKQEKSVLRRGGKGGGVTQG